VRAWLAARPRYHAHFTPTYASWLNQVERWFGLVTQRAIRRASVRTTRELVRRIEAFVGRLQRHRPAVRLDRHARVDPRQARRLLQAISGSRP
jgi:putative transposase